MRSSNDVCARAHGLASSSSDQYFEALILVLLLLSPNRNAVVNASPQWSFSASRSLCLVLTISAKAWFCSYWSRCQLLSICQRAIRLHHSCSALPRQPPDESSSSVSITGERASVWLCDQATKLRIPASVLSNISESSKRSPSPRISAAGRILGR